MIITETFCMTDCMTESVRIDSEHGILYGVKIIGCTSRNGRIYSDSVLAAAVPLYEGAKVNVNHPEGSVRRGRSYRDRFGVIRNVVLKSGDGLYADLHFNPKHSLAEQFLWDAEHSPENAGFSHNVEAVVKRDGNQTVVEEIVAVRSVDLVADPAATSGLFEEVQSEPVNGKNEQTELAMLIRSLLETLTEKKPQCKERTMFAETLDSQRFAQCLKQ